MLRRHKKELKANKGPVGFQCFGLFGIPRIYTKTFFPLEFSSTSIKTTLGLYTLL